MIISNKKQEVKGSLIFLKDDRYHFTNKDLINREYYYIEDRVIRYEYKRGLFNFKDTLIFESIIPSKILKHICKKYLKNTDQYLPGMLHTQGFNSKGECVYKHSGICFSSHYSGHFYDKNSVKDIKVTFDNNTKNTFQYLLRTIKDITGYLFDIIEYQILPDNRIEITFKDVFSINPFEFYLLITFLRSIMYFPSYISIYLFLKRRYNNINRKFLLCLALSFSDADYYGTDLIFQVPIDLGSFGKYNYKNVCSMSLAFNIASKAKRSKNRAAKREYIYFSSSIWKNTFKIKNPEYYKDFEVLIDQSIFDTEEGMKYLESGFIKTLSEEAKEDFFPELLESK